MLIKLMDFCNSVGSTLDGTATHESKYIDRQRAHMDVYHVLYGILVDNPQNEYREEDLQKAEEHLNLLDKLKSKEYPDRRGIFNIQINEPNTPD